MKIKEVKEKLKITNEMRAECIRLKLSDGDNENLISELEEKTKELTAQIPEEFRAIQIVDTLKNRVQSFFNNDPETTSMIKDVLSLYQKKAPIALESFPDDMDVEEAISRANKLRSFE